MKFGLIKQQNKLNTHPELNCFKGGRMTAFLPMTQYRPVLTLAKSPRIIAPVWTITLPFSTMFWEPQMTVCRLTLFPEALNIQNMVCLHIKYYNFGKQNVTVSTYSSLLYNVSWTSINICFCVSFFRCEYWRKCKNDNKLEEWNVKFKCQNDSVRLFCSVVHFGRWKT